MKGPKFLGLLAFVIQLNAQSSDVTTCIPDYQWAIFRNQTPCSIAASLESACGALHQVNQIPAGTHYIGPSLSDADPCTCNSVTYSLVEACGGCQNRPFILPFALWKVNCTQAQVGSIGEFPSSLPSGVEIPSWAKLNISEAFDPDAAREAAANDVPLTTTSNMAFSSTEQTSPSQSSGTPLSGGSSRGVSPGAIAGITVGVLMAVVCILLLMFWRMLARRRRNSTQAHGSVDPFNEKQRQSFPLDYIQSRPVSDPTSIAMPRTYSPMDINSGLGSSTIFAAGPVRSSIDDTISPQTAMSPKTIVTSHNIGPGGYTGAPEV